MSQAATQPAKTPRQISEESIGRKGRSSSGPASRDRDYAAITEAYVARVMSGEEMVCHRFRQMVERHCNDILRSSDPSYPYYYDDQGGKRYMRLFELVKPSKWPTRMVAEDWFVAVHMMLFGWKNKQAEVVGEDAKGRPIMKNLRRFRVAYFRWPRKTGKSADMSVTGIYMTAYDGEQGAEVYAAALTEDQARRVFDEAVAMVDGTPELRGLFTKVGDQPCRALKHKKSFSEFRPLSRDKDTMEGKHIHCAIGDEVHKWKGRAHWDVLRYGMRARKQPLQLGITTAPAEDDTTSICNSLDNYAEKVLDGAIDDAMFFPCILEIDQEIKDGDGNIIVEGDRWDDETKWKKACPNLGVTVKLEDMRQEALEAANDAEALNAFQRYSLNIRVGSLEKAIEVTEWNKCAIDGNPVEVRKATIERLKGRLCFGALDLASTDDTSSLVLNFPPTQEGEPAELLSFFWIPNDNILTRVSKHHVPYNVWRDQGFLITTPGRVTDYDFIVEQIFDIDQLFDLRELAYDPALASGLINKVLSDKTVDGKVVRKGMKKDKIVKFAQTMLNYSQPCGDFVRAIARKEIRHSGDPVLRWQVSNLRWIKNHTGLFMPDKEKSIEKIDGVVASIMAFGRATHPDNAKLLKAKPRVSTL